MEVLPKAVFHKQQTEALYYETFFSSVGSWVNDLDAIVAEAEKVGSQFGLNMGDALHIASALLAGALEFVTAERPTSPFKNVVGIKVVSIYVP